MTTDLLRLRPYQAKALETITEGLGKACRPDSDDPRRIAVVLPTGAGKGHTPDTGVPTPAGLRKWGELQPGDYVFGSNGQPTEVLAIYDRGEIPAYRVEFSDGASVVVDGDHLWAVRDHKYRRTSREVRTMATAEILAEGLRHERSHRFNVPMTAPVEHAAKSLPIDPYTLGALIANGSLAGAGTQLTTPDEEVIERVRCAHEVRRIKDTTPGVCDRYSLPRLSWFLRDLGLNVRSAEKHIPAVYLESSTADRVALFQGLMDCDGSSRGGGRRSVLFHTTSPGLVADVTELVTSLGGTAKPKWATRIREDRPASIECSLSILLPSEISPFHSSRKLRDERPRRTFQPRRAIVGITPVGNQPISCIRVAADDQLYLVTRQHIVTHNTVLFAHLAANWARHHGHAAGLPHRVLILVHRDELVTQAVDKLRQVAPGVPVGVVKGPRNDVDHPVIVASVQTLGRENRLSELVSPAGTSSIGLVIVDECHHASATGYRYVMDRLGCYRPGGAVAVGFTATMARGDGQGLGDVWQEVVYRLDILDLIEQGHLVDVAGRRVTVDGLTFENVTKRGGDYAPTSLSEALMSADAMRVTADAYERYAKDRSGIVFTPNVQSAFEFTEEFQARGIKTAPVYGSMRQDSRRHILEEFKQGKIQVLVNCAVLTEGFDAPIASCAVIARPTLSAALYVQCIGRILRPYPGKTDALVLDVAGASEMHQLATLADLSTRRLETVADGESLTAAVRREREAGNPALADYVVDSYEVDLFRRSEALWLQTRAGVWFTTTKDQLYFLWPGSEPDLYKAGKRPTRGAGGAWIAEDVDFGTAQGWCEQEALADDAANKADGGASLALKNASWRKGRTPASPQQMTKLFRLGVTPRNGITKREASDLISIELASRVLDKAIAGRK